MLPRAVICCLMAGAQLCAQGWKHWPCKVAWTQSVSGKPEDREFGSISWTAPGPGPIELYPGSGLEADDPVVQVRFKGKTARVVSLEESDNALKNIFGGLEWPPAFNMIGEPNKLDLEMLERKGWVLFRLSWTTNYQGYTPNGLMVLAWNRRSGRWRAVGCLGDEIRLKAVGPSEVKLKAQGVVRAGASNDYMDWDQEILLQDSGNGMADYELGPLQLKPLK